MSERKIVSLSGLARLSLFSAGIFCFYNVLDDFAFFRVVDYQLARRDLSDPTFNMIVYVGSYLSCVIGLVVLYSHASKWVRYFSYLATVLTVTTFLGFKNFNGYGFTYHEATLIWAEAEFIDDALRFSVRSYIAPLLFSVGVVVALEWLARLHLPLIHSWILCIIPIAAVPINRELLERTYAKVYESPIPYRVPLLANYALEHRVLYYGERDDPYLSPTRPPVAEHVLFIVDESVAGERLGVNGAENDTTPFLESIPEKIFNYGVISAPSNLSSTTNIILQSGLRMDQVPDSELRSLKNPNIFSYMERAGFRCFMVDVQIYSDKPTNLMTGFDIQKLDGHIYVRRLEVGSKEYEMDYKAIDYVERMVSENERSFIYLLKTGVHFPYDAKYPPDRKFFSPILADGGIGGNLAKTLNSYRNALRWSVDGFIEELFRRFEGGEEKLLVFYTSDHGQSLEQAVDDEGETLIGKPRDWPHGTPLDPPVQQAMVPLILFTFDPEAHRVLGGLYDPSLKDKLSAFELFSSVLYLAGYDYGEIREHYERSIFDASRGRGKRFFVSGNLFGIGGSFYQSGLIRSSNYRNDFEPEQREDH